MTIKQLNQLKYLGGEIKMNQRRVEELRSKAEGGVSRLTGTPRSKTEKNNIERYVTEIIALNDRIMADQRRCQGYISRIDDSLMRSVFTLKFVHNFRWKKIAFRIGGGNTEDGIKQAYYRFLRKNGL